MYAYSNIQLVMYQLYVSLSAVAAGPSVDLREGRLKGDE